MNSRSIFYLFFISMILIPASSVAATINDSYHILFGEWKNTNENTQGITRITFINNDNGVIVKTFGRCVPTECELEDTYLVTKDGAPLEIFYEEPLFTMTLEPVLLASSVLQVKITKHFFDANATIKEKTIFLNKQ